MFKRNLKIALSGIILLGNAYGAEGSKEKLARPQLSEPLDFEKIKSPEKANNLTSEQVKKTEKAIECPDLSNISIIYSSKKGKLNKKKGREYRIQNTETNTELAPIYEVLTITETNELLEAIAAKKTLFSSKWDKSFCIDHHFKKETIKIELGSKAKTSCDIIPFESSYKFALSKAEKNIHEMAKKHYDYFCIYTEIKSGKYARKKHVLAVKGTEKKKPMNSAIEDTLLLNK